MATDTDPSTLGPDHVCKHGTAMDVHCCNCHSGFLFSPGQCVCGETLDCDLCGRTLLATDAVTDEAEELVICPECAGEEGGSPAPSP